LVAIDDLLVYGSVISRPTGIQRVASGIAEALVREHGAQTVHVGSGTVRRAALPAGGRRSVSARVSEPFLRLLAHAPRPAQERVRSVARRALSRVRSLSTGDSIQVQAGDWLVILGAPWIAPGMAAAAIGLATTQNLRIALLVHDLLPSTDPQWFGDAQGVAAKRDMDELIEAADHLFAVSPEVAAELRSRTARPVDICPPADPLFPLTLPARRSSMRFVGDAPIVLAVGTLHPRKNLAALVRIWDTWVGNSERAAHGSGAVPILVIAGRRHPQDGDLFAALAAHPRARERIALIHDASDGDLALLYAQARFLVMPSLAEGWGMPIREALVAGTPSISSDAVPAANGSPFVRSVPAGDDVELSRAIHEWWEGDEPERRADDIRRHFVPRRWSDVSREIRASLRV
jgi:glycosyltransferase involved in cell wall biosynthesis